MISKQRMRVMPSELLFILVVTNDSPVLPPLQGAIREPNSSIDVCDDGTYVDIRQTLVHRNGRDRKVPKAVETVRSDHPDRSFAVLKDTVHLLARKAVGHRKHVRPSVMYMHNPAPLCSDPQAAIAIAEQAPRPKLQTTRDRICLGFPVQESPESALPSLPPRESPCCLHTNALFRDQEHRPLRSTWRCHCESRRAFQRWPSIR